MKTFANRAPSPISPGEGRSSYQRECNTSLHLLVDQHQGFHPRHLLEVTGTFGGFVHGAPRNCSLRAGPHCDRNLWGNTEDHTGTAARRGGGAGRAGAIRASCRRNRHRGDGQRDPGGYEDESRQASRHRWRHARGSARDDREPRLRLRRAGDCLRRARNHARLYR